MVAPSNLNLPQSQVAQVLGTVVSDWNSICDMRFSRQRWLCAENSEAQNDGDAAHGTRSKRDVGKCREYISISGVPIFKNKHTKWHL